MEFGKLTEAPLSKSYTVALLYLSAAAAEKMKEAEVVKKKKEEKSWGWGKGVGWQAPSPTPEAGKTLGIICFYTHQSIHTEEGLFTS